jgi:hypothetical protein
MIEPESAAGWFDECLRTTADLRNVLWIMAANETRGIPAPLLSRVSVHQIEPPPASAFSSVLAGLLDGIAGDIGCQAADLPALEEETQDALRRSFARHRNLRRLRAMVEECLGVRPRPCFRRRTRGSPRTLPGLKRPCCGGCSGAAPPAGRPFRIVETEHRAAQSARF